jgi:hypothetical protein
MTLDFPYSFPTCAKVHTERVVGIRMDDLFLRDLGSLDSMMDSLAGFQASSSPVNSSAAAQQAAAGIQLERPGSTTSSVLAGLALGSPTTAFPAAGPGSFGAPRVGRRSAHQVSFVPIATAASPAAEEPPLAALSSAPALMTTPGGGSGTPSLEPAAASGSAPTPLFTPNPHPVIPAGGPSWLDGDEDVPAVRAEPSPAVAVPPDTQRPSPSVSSSQQLPPLSVPGSVAPAAAIATKGEGHAVTTVAAAAHPKETELSLLTPDERLKHEERLLLAELFALDRQLEASDAELRTLAAKVQTELAATDTTLITKQLQCSRAAEELAASRKSFQASAAARRKQIEASSAEELSTMMESATAAASAQLNRQLQSLELELESSQQNARTLEKHMELLLLDGAFTEQGVYARLTSADTIPEKLASSMDIISAFVEKQLTKARDKIQTIIREETTAAIGSIWNERNIQLQKDSIERRVAFGDFLHESLQVWIDFSASRSEEKHQRRRNLHLELSEAGRKLRTKAVDRNTEAQRAVMQRIEQDSKAFTQIYAESMSLIQTKCRAIEASDEVVAAQQQRDMAHRLATDKRIADKILADELEAVALRWRREEQIMQTETMQQSVNALQAARERCEELVAGPLSRSEALRAHVTELTSAERLRQKDLLADPSAAATTLRKGTIETGEAFHVRQLLQEKEHVLAQLMAEISAGRQAIQQDYERCGKIRQTLERKISQLVSGISEARCTVQGGLGRCDMIRTSWEKEHRALLSRGHELIVDCRSTDAASAQAGSDRGGCGNSQEGFRATAPVQHPLLESLILVALTIRDKLHALFENFERQHRDRMALLRHQNISDAMALEHYDKVSAAWNALFNQLSSMNAQGSELATKQVAVTVESAKFQIERDMLEVEKKTLAKSIMKLSEASDRLRQESEAALAERDKKVAQLRAMHREQDEMWAEQMRLAQLQSDLRHRQDEVHRQDVALAEKTAMAQAAALRSASATAADLPRPGKNHHARVALAQVAGPNSIGVGSSVLHEPDQLPGA